MKALPLNSFSVFDTFPGPIQLDLSAFFKDYVRAALAAYHLKSSTQSIASFGRRVLLLLFALNQFGSSRKQL